MILLAAAYVLFAFGTDLSRPLLGNFAGRSVPYAMFAENFLRGAELWKPTADVLVNGQKTVCLLDLPLISYAAAFFKWAFRPAGLELIGRCLSVLATLAGAFYFSRLTGRLFEKRELNPALSPALFLFSPLAVIYGQSFQNEALGLYLLVLSAWFLYKEPGIPTNRRIFLSAFNFSLAEAARLHFALFLLPLLYRAGEDTKGGERLGRLILFLAVSQAVPVLWYGYCYYGTQAYDSVIWSLWFQLGAKTAPLPEYFHVDFLKTLAKNTLVYPFAGIGIVAFAAGLTAFLREKRRFLLLWGVSSVLLLVLFGKKVVEHNYYLMPALPLAAWGMAYGCGRRSLRTLFLIAYVGASLYFSAHVLLGVPASERGLLADAALVRESVPAGSRVVYSGYGLPMMYYSGREGWNSDLEGEMPGYLRQNLELRGLEPGKEDLGYFTAQGASYLVVNRKTSSAKAEKLLHQTDSLSLYSLARA